MMIKAAAPIIGLVLLLLMLLVAVVAIPVIAVIAVLYNSPFAIFLPSVSTGDTIKRLEKELSGEIRTKAIASIVGVVSFILMIVCFYYSEDGSLGVLLAIFFIITGFCIAGLYASRGSVEEIQKNLRIARSDFEKYKKDIEEWNRREAERLLMEEGSGVRCPYCHSSNTTKISSFSKEVSVAVLGVYAMGKVSKQWHCNICGSDF